MHCTWGLDWVYMVWCGYEGGAAGDSGRSGAVGLGVCGTSRGYFKPCLLPRAAVSSFLCFESYVRVKYVRCLNSFFVCVMYGFMRVRIYPAEPVHD